MKTSDVEKDPQSFTNRIPSVAALLKKREELPNDLSFTPVLL